MFDTTDTEAQKPGNFEERVIIDEEVDLDRLITLLAETVENTTTQKITAARGFLRNGRPERTAEILRTIQDMNQAILEVLRNPSNQIPVDHSTYEGKPIIALDEVRKRKQLRDLAA